MATSRRLAAIMFTDIVGYTALTQADEAGALQLLARHHAILRPFFPKFNGHEVKVVGDSFLVEFASALDATHCAIEIQRSLYEHHLPAPDGSSLRIRIGIHLGDVVHSADDVFGDSVNIASRIEPLAEPGGVCVSEPVFGQVRNKIPNTLEKLGPQVLKNVQFPLDVYRVVLPWAVTESTTQPGGPMRLAVLPFANISPDSRDEYFAEGLTEELISVLSQIRDLRVIARTSVMQYRSTTKAVAQIGAELGVASILEGSVRKAGNRLRITAQLIDVGSQGHLWAKTYDRELDDVFAVQSELAKQVAEALKIVLRDAEQTRLDARPPVRSDSYLAYLKGRTLMHSDTRTALEEAKRQFELAISLDPGNAAAHAGLADVTRFTRWVFPGLTAPDWEESCRRSALRAIELDPNLADAHTTLALAHWDHFDYPASEAEFERALALNPSSSLAHSSYAVALEDEARVEEAVIHHELAVAADPYWATALALLIRLLIWLGRLDEALVKIQRLREIEPTGHGYHNGLAAYYLARSDLTRWREEMTRVQELEPEPRWLPVRQAWIHAVSGEKDAARALLRHEETLPVYLYTAWAVAIVFAELGDLDECFRWIEKAWNPSMPVQVFRLEPRMEPVRRDPRFQLVLKKMHLA